VNRSLLRWTVAALAGLVFAVGIGIAASTLASERIGLSSEPVNAGGELAPAAVKDPARSRPRPHRKVRPVPAPTPPQPAAPAQPPVVGGAGDSGHVEVERESEPDGDGDD
jgi:hypothetical protein